MYIYIIYIIYKIYNIYICIYIYIYIYIYICTVRKENLQHDKHVICNGLSEHSAEDMFIMLKIW